MPYSQMQNMFSKLQMQQPVIVQLKDELFNKRNCAVSMLRLDEVHPHLSGNKIFKLFYFLQNAVSNPGKRIVTMGGAFSNHLAATAFACANLNIPCTGIIRGERPPELSHTLLFCLGQGMDLLFVSRNTYANITLHNFVSFDKHFEGQIFVPEGGFCETGKKGVALISSFFNENNFTQICLPVGTATTFAGIIDRCDSGMVTGFSVLKNMHDISKRFSSLNVQPGKNYSFIDQYYFGGYARRSQGLIDFMNSFFDKHKIPLDFVYTAKMMFGVYDLIAKNNFKAGSKILCLHTGGLQGNSSLPQGSLIF